MLEEVVTKVTARPMDTAGLVSLETPINEQRPKNLERIKLLIKTIEIIMAINLLTSIASYLFYLSICLKFNVPIIDHTDQYAHSQQCAGC